MYKRMLRNGTQFRQDGKLLHMPAIVSESTVNPVTAATAPAVASIRKRHANTSTVVASLH